MDTHFESESVKVKTGYDLDGTLIEDMPKYKGKSYYQLSKNGRKARQKWKLIWFETAKPIMNPKERKFSIITNRSSKFRAETKKWIRRYFNGRCKRLVMNSGANFFHKDTLYYKATVINEEKFDRYYENSKRLCKSLRKKCPNCEIILVKDGEVIEKDPRFSR